MVIQKTTETVQCTGDEWAIYSLIYHIFQIELLSNPQVLWVFNEFRESTGDLSRSTEIEIKKHKSEAFQMKEKQEELQAEQESVVCLSLGDRTAKAKKI